MAECNIDKCCFDDVKMSVKVNSVNGIKPNADGEVDIDEHFVTTNTPQTIIGTKDFANTIKTNGMNHEAMLTTMNGLKIDTAPTVINKSSIKWNDKEQNEVSSIEVTRPANTKDTCISLSANTITEWGSNEKASIDIHAKAGAISYATAPTPSSNATSNEIVTAKWVIDKGLADDTNVVHKSGNETITGSKTFSNQMYLGSGGTGYGLISAKDTNSILRLFGGTSPSTGANLDLYGEGSNSGNFVLRARTTDKQVALEGRTNGVLTWGGEDLATTAWVRTYVNSAARSSISPNYSNATTLTAEGSSAVGSSISAYYSNANVELAGSPNGSLTWGGKNLITTEFVKGTNYWYRKHSDGFIEMGGFTDCANAPDHMVVATNLPLAFSNTNYTLLVQMTRGTASGTSWGNDYSLPTTRSKTTTRFEVYSNDIGYPGANGGGYNWYACGY